VTHYTDMVVQAPPRQMGFNHAGNEIWYMNSSGLEYKTCVNNPGSAESTACADSYYLTTGIDAHLHYLDKPISGMCIATQENDVVTQIYSLIDSFLN
jgi:hypothetical protein